MLQAFCFGYTHGMNRISRPVAATTGLLLFASAVFAQSAPAVTAPAVAVVNGQSVSKTAFDLAINEQLQRGAADSAQLRQAVRQELILQTLLAQEALKGKLEQTEVGQVALENVRRAALAQLWQQNWFAQHPIKAEAIEAEYKNFVAQLGDTEYHIRHVLLKDETAAKLVLQQAQAGTPLAQLAEKYSEDAVSKTEGGLLNWAAPATLVPGLGDAVKVAKVGKLPAAPVQSQAGWHVLLVEAKRPLVAPKLDQVRLQLAQVIGKRELAQAVQALVNATKIE